jgi:endonuclease/exonuclease/phosphatase family metal-dependent hydrolase
MRQLLAGLLVAATASVGACSEESGSGSQGTGATGTAPSGGGGAGASSTSSGASGGAGGAGAGGHGAEGAAGGEAPGFAVVSLNLHCLRLDGTSYGTNEERFAAIAAEVAAEDVGILVMQEVCVQGETDAISLLATALESATATDWSSAWEYAHVAWEGTPNQADEGLGLLVRGEIGATRALEHTTQGALRRVALAVELPSELGGLWVVSTHLEYDDSAARLAQARELASFGLSLGSTPGQVIVAGDFNDPKTGPAYGALGDFGYVDATASLSASLIDHVLAHRGAPLAVTDAKRLFDGVDGPTVSDHPGVLVRLAQGVGDDFPLTTIRIHASPAPGAFFAVRGSVAPLDWGWGWPAHEVTEGLWELRLSEIAGGTFEFKSLRDDVGWQTGSNESGTAGAVNDSTPVF